MVEYAATPSGAYSEQWMNTPSPVVLRQMAPKGSGASDGVWRSPLHMPEWAARIHLEITGVRVERLQDISEADAIEEGAVTECLDCDALILLHRSGEPHWLDMQGKDADPVDAYAVRWDAINAKRAPWDTNPFVWVYEFRRLT